MRRRRGGFGQTVGSSTDLTAVVTMAMRRDFPHAAVSLASLDSQLGTTIQHFVLINDEPDPDLERRLAGHPHRHVLSVKKNLGVPGGRNLLLREALRWGADRIITFDDDLIAPEDYLKRLISAHHRLTSADDSVGVIAPAVLNYGFVRDSLLGERTRNKLDKQIPAPAGSTRRWHQRIRRLGAPLQAGEIEHLGIRDWEQHYLNVGSRSLDRWWVGLGNESVISPHRETVLANALDARSEVSAPRPEPLAVDTVPGGVWCTSRSTIESVGFLDTAFSPFGFEDADWCVRATRMGFTNYCVPAVLIAHDYQERLVSRESGESFKTRGRSRSILIRKHASAESIISEGLQALVEVLDTLHLPVNRRQHAVTEYGTGLIEGLRTTTPAAADHTGDLRSRGSVWCDARAGAYQLPELLELPGDVDLRLGDVHLGSRRANPQYESVRLRWMDQPDGMTRSNLTLQWPDGAILRIDIELATAEPASTLSGSVVLIGKTAVGHALSLLGVSDSGLPSMLDCHNMAGRSHAITDAYRAITHIVEDACQDALRIELEIDPSGSKELLVAVRHNCPTTHGTDKPQN